MKVKVMGSGLKLDISKFPIKNPFPVTHYLMGQGRMEGLAGEVMITLQD
jgi:hypothetical protein